MERKEFKAESKRLLDLMINSIYTHKEIFLRELISNASDALDKMYYKALTDDSISFDKDNYYIRISVNKPARTLTVSDTGIGMTKEELEDNLGIIAKSGSYEFKKNNDKKEDIDIIGQFGVGFYSAFMVADRVRVISRAHGADSAYLWESEGASGYTIDIANKSTVGTDIILTLKQDTENENYSEFLEEWRIRELVKKYSDFIRYPIKMTVEKTKPAEDKDKEPQVYFEEETLNSMVPIWRKNKSELKPEDYINFYKDKHYGFDDPLKYVHINAEGAINYRAILYIPSHAPFDYYTKEYRKGLELYSSGVLIMDKCPDLLPDYFGFVQGMVDSENLSLNISREMLQHDRQLHLIEKRITDKIKSELHAMLKDEREKYEEFFKVFGRTIKYGIYTGFGGNNEVLQDLLMFYSSKEKKLVTLEEYLSRMSENQKYIYYAVGDSPEKIAQLPQTEAVIEKGMEILFLTEEIDEFAIKMLFKYKDREFKSVSDSGDLGLDSEEDKKQEDANQKEEEQEILEAVKKTLGDRVKSVVASKKLKTHPVCLSSEGALSIEMEKVLKSMPTGEKVKAQKVLEINTSHSVFAALKAAKDNPEKFEMYAKLLFEQALLIEGLPLENPVEFSNNICKLMN